MTTKMNRFSLLFLLIISTFTFSCNEGESEIQVVDLKDLQLNIDFKNSYKITGKEDLVKIVGLFVNELYPEVTTDNSAGRTTETDTPDGFQFYLEGDVLTVTPIVDVNSDCGEGWTNHGVCYSAGCVSDKVEKALAPVADAAGCVQVKVIRTLTHARVCSKEC